MLSTTSSDKPLTWEEAIESARANGCDDVELDDELEGERKIVGLGNGGVNKGETYPTCFGEVLAFMNEHGITRLSVVDVPGDGTQVEGFDANDNYIFDWTDEALEAVLPSIYSLLLIKCGPYSEAGGSITADDDGDVRFEGNITKRVRA